MGGTAASAEQEGATRCYDGKVRRTTRVLRCFFKNALWGSRSYKSVERVKACHQAWAKASASMYGESIAALIDALRRSPRFVERLLDDVIPVVDREQSFAKKVFGARDDECMKVQFEALRKALLGAAAAPDTDPITVYAACGRRHPHSSPLCSRRAGSTQQDGIPPGGRTAGDRCDAQDLKRYRKRDHKLGGAPADGAAFACSLCDAVEHCPEHVGLRQGEAGRRRAGLQGSTPQGRCDDRTGAGAGQCEALKLVPRRDPVFPSEAA